MTLPFPNPTTRNEARDNAIYYAKQAASCALADEDTDARWMTEQSRAWSAIADTFPEDCIECTSEEPDGMTLVAEDWVEEAVDAIAFKNRMRVEPGYSFMAVTPQEQRTLMALRTGHPDKPSETAVTGRASVPLATDDVPVNATFYMALMAIVVNTLRSAGGMINVTPENTEATRDVTVQMSHSALPGEEEMWKVWIDSE